MSILGKQWKIINEDPSKNVIEKILINRGLTGPQQIESFLKLSFKKGTHNPFLMKDMEKAVERIKKALREQERIMIFGDYDVDGISGTALLFHALKSLGAKVSYRLPHRVEHGYGLSNAFIEEFSNLKVQLLITVDCGISCKDQVDLAVEKNIDVIITDHHSIPEKIPDKAIAILHPLQQDCEYPFKGLTGAGVAYKLACALIVDLLPPEDRDRFMFDLLDLASLGTVADMGPLIDENRVIVKYGLQALQQTKWYGLNFLKEYAGIEQNAKLDISAIGFRLGPRINAAGRIDSPYYALQLLLYDKHDEKGKILAGHLEKLNQKRQQMVIEAVKEIEDPFTDQHGKKKIFIAWNEGWHAGILGLLAAKCVEKFMVPSIILQDMGDYLVGSARSLEFFNIVEALKMHRDLLKSFGGHVQAAGFTIEKEKLTPFIASMENYAEGKIQSEQWKPTLEIDCEIQELEIENSLIDFLEQLEPYGIGNSQPTFIIKNLKVKTFRRVGKDQNHLQFQVYSHHKQFSVIGFKFGEYESYLRENPAIDLVCNLEKNEWKGNTKIQLKAVDFVAAA